MIGRSDDDGKRRMVGHVFDHVGTEGIVQCHADESERVTREIDNLPFGPVQGPDADGKVRAVDVFGLGRRALGARSEFALVLEPDKGLADVESSCAEFAVRELRVECRGEDGGLGRCGGRDERAPFHDGMVGVDGDGWENAF